jgi:hypothetical protein
VEPGRLKTHFYIIPIRSITTSPIIMEYVTLTIVPARKNNEFLLMSSLRAMVLDAKTNANAVYCSRNMNVRIRKFSHLPITKPVSSTSLLIVWLNGFDEILPWMYLLFP